MSQVERGVEDAIGRDFIESPTFDKQNSKVATLDVVKISKCVGKGGGDNRFAVPVAPTSYREEVASMLLVSSGIIFSVGFRVLCGP